MPDDTMMSALCRISCSLMLQPNAFQVFQPRAGVRARPFSRACAGDAAVRTEERVTVAARVNRIHLRIRNSWRQSRKPFQEKYQHIVRCQYGEFSHGWSQSFVRERSIK